MNRLYSMVAFLSLVLCTASALAEESHSVIDTAGLKKILVDLGYTPAAIKAGESESLQIEIKHSNGDIRRHLLGIDADAGTLFIIGGGFESAPDPKKGSNEWFRKLLNHNHKMAPNYIFINDNDVFGLATVIGNVDINAERLKAKIKIHVTNFDQRLVPLVKELP